MLNLVGFVLPADSRARSLRQGTDRCPVKLEVLEEINLNSIPSLRCINLSKFELIVHIVHWRKTWLPSDVPTTLTACTWANTRQRQDCQREFNRFCTERVESSFRIKKITPAGGVLRSKPQTTNVTFFTVKGVNSVSLQEKLPEKKKKKSYGLTASYWLNMSSNPSSCEVTGLWRPSHLLELLSNAFRRV